MAAARFWGKGCPKDSIQLRCHWAATQTSDVHATRSGTCDSLPTNLVSVSVPLSSSRAEKWATNKTTASMKEEIEKANPLLRYQIPVGPSKLGFQFLKSLCVVSSMAAARGLKCTLEDRALHNGLHSRDVVVHFISLNFPSDFNPCHMLVKAEPARVGPCRPRGSPRGSGKAKEAGEKKHEKKKTKRQDDGRMRWSPGQIRQFLLADS